MVRSRSSRIRSCVTVLAASTALLAAEAAAAPAVAVTEGNLDGRWPGLSPSTVRTRVRDGLEGIAGFDVETASSIQCADAACWQESAQSLGVTHILVPSARFVDNDADIRLEVYDGRSGALVVSAEASCEICAKNEVDEMLTATAVRVRSRLETLAERPAALVVEGSPTGAEVVVDGEVVGQTPYRGSIPAGAHSVVVTANGFRPEKFDVYVESGDTEILDPDLRGRGRGGRPPERDDGAPFGRLGYAGLGLGLASLALIGTGVGLLIVDGDPVESTCPGGGPDVNGRCPRMYDTRVGGLSSLAVGGAALVGATTLIVLDRTTRRSATVAAGWRSISVSVRF